MILLCNFLIFQVIREVSQIVTHPTPVNKLVAERERSEATSESLTFPNIVSEVRIELTTSAL